MTVLISPHQFALRGKFLASGYFALVQCGYVNQTHNFASSCAPLIFYIDKILSKQLLIIHPFMQILSRFVHQNLTTAMKQIFIWYLT